jgi:hypothetical protein
MRRIGYSWLVLLLVALASCAPRGTNGAEDRRGGVSEGSGANQEPIDWDNPIGGQRVASAVAAGRLVNFPVTPPSALGDPTAIYAVAASAGDAGAVEFIFDLEVGRVVVAEFQWDYPASHWNDFVSSVVSSSNAANDQPRSSGGGGRVRAGVSAGPHAS